MTVVNSTHNHELMKIRNWWKGSIFVFITDYFSLCQPKLLKIRFV
jgi:hypothetical protein